MLHEGDSQSLPLNKEEAELIRKCTDPEVKQLMILNRTKNKHLRDLYLKISKVLKECEKQIEEKVKVAEGLEMMRYKRVLVHSTRLGYPYFKDKKGRSCPPNPDAVRKQKSCEVVSTYYKKASRWLPEDQKLLQTMVIAYYNRYRLKELKYQIGKVDVQKHNDDKSMEMAIELNQQLEQLGNNIDNPEPPPMYCSKGIDWYDISTDIKGWY